MRDEKEILEKCRRVYNTLLEQRKKKMLSVGYLNCQHNLRCRIREQGQVGFCNNLDLMKVSRRRIIVCNNDDTARRCKFFECAHTEEEVEREFEEIIKNPSRCGQEYPRLAVLLWVLQKPFSSEKDEDWAKGLMDSVVSSILSFLKPKKHND